MTDPPLVEIDSLTVRREGVTLVESVSLRIPPGTIHVLAGPNGAGKTTILKAVLGQIPFEGTVRCAWRRGGRIGYVPQAPEFDRELPLTVADFLAMMWQRKPVCLGSSGPVRTRIAAALGAVGLAPLANRRLGVLSGGEMQRALLAQALDPVPELLLLDEPTAGVDAEGLRSVEETLLRLKKESGVTTLLVSHDADQVRRIGDQVSRLNRTLQGEGA